MMRKILAIVMVLALLWPATAVATNCSPYRSWITGDSLSASDLSTSFTTVATTQMTPQCLGDYSATSNQMNATTDPNSAGSGSLATSTAGELERLRYVLAHTFGRSQWWTHYEDINVGHRGLRNHLTVLTAYKDQFRTESTWANAAVRFHALAVSVSDAGSHPESALALFHVGGVTRLLLSKTGDVHLGGAMAVWPGTVQYPSYTGVADHQTGFYFPAQNHVGVVIGRTEIARLHGYGVVLAPHAALAFRHAGGSLHVTGVSLGSGDAVQVGDSNTALQFRGAGYSAGGNRLIGLNAAGTAVETKAISGTSGISVTHTAGGIALAVTGNQNFAGSRGQFSFTGSHATQYVFRLQAHGVALMNASSHTTSTVVNPSAQPIDIRTTGPAGGGRDRAAEFSANSWVHFYWIYDGTNVSGVASANDNTVGPNLPHSFTSWTYAGAVRHGSTGLVGTHIMGAIAYYDTTQTILAGGNATSETTVDLASAVPPNALAAGLHVTVLLSAGGAVTDTGILRVSSGRDWFRLGIGSGTASLVKESAQIEIPNISQRLYYLTATTGTAPLMDIDVRSYRLPNGGS